MMTAVNDAPSLTGGTLSSQPEDTVNPPGETVATIASVSAGNADALCNELGLTGLPFINVANGCATGGSSLLAACNAIGSGQYDIGLVAGFDKHDRGAFNANPADLGLGNWYGEMGLMMTTQFFAMKIQKYMHDYGITQQSLARVASKAFRNGSINPMAWRRKPLSEVAYRNRHGDPV